MDNGKDMSLRSDQVGELLAASKLEMLSMSLFDSSNVEIALECTHVGKRFCPVTLYPRRLYRITFGGLANVTPLQIYPQIRSGRE